MEGTNLVSKPPRFRYLTEEETRNFTSSGRVNLSEFRELLKNVDKEAWAEISLEDNETVWTVRRRIAAVAKERGLIAHFKKASNPRAVWFRLDDE